MLEKTMNCGINYAYIRPHLDGVIDFYNMAVFYVMPQYTDYAENYLQEVFPDNPCVTMSLPCIDRVIQGVLLGRRHHLMHVLRPSFYDLARAAPPDTYSTNTQDTDGHASRSQNYAYSRPMLEDVVYRYDAAVFYMMTQYRLYSESYLKETFHDSPGALSTLPCIDRAIQGVLLGRHHQLMYVLRPSFYDLARAEIPAISSTNNQDKEGCAIRSHLKKLPLEDLITLLDLQKRLVLCWENVFKLLSINCSSCRKTRRIEAVASQVRHEFPHDPVLGIHYIMSRAPFSASHCQSATTTAKNQLIDGRSPIWEKISMWITAGGVS